MSEKLKYSWSAQRIPGDCGCVLEVVNIVNLGNFRRYSGHGLHLWLLRECRLRNHVARIKRKCKNEFFFSTFTATYGAENDTWTLLIASLLLDLNLLFLFPITSFMLGNLDLFLKCFNSPNTKPRGSDFHLDVRGSLMFNDRQVTDPTPCILRIVLMHFSNLWYSNDYGAMCLHYRKQ